MAHGELATVLIRRRVIMQYELNHLVEALPGLGWTALADGGAEFFNQRWLDYTGLSAEQAQGVGWLEIIHPRDRQGLIDHWRSCLASGVAGDTEARMRRWLRTAVNISRPWRDYSLAEFGLDPHLLRERFARYTDTFGIEIERRAAEAATAALD